MSNVRQGVGSRMNSKTVITRRVDGTEVEVDAEDALITHGLTAADYYIMQAENEALRDWVTALEREVSGGTAAITEKTIQAGLMTWAMQERHHALVVPNSNTLFSWEADLITVTRAGLTHEYEIKLNPADYKRDAVKEHKHWTIRRGDGFGPCYFWYVTHDFEIDPPDHAGWLLVDCIDGHWNVHVKKDAPRFDGLRITDRRYSDIARMLSWRLANYSRRYFAEGGGVSRAENSATYRRLKFQLERAQRELAECRELAATQAARGTCRA